MINHEITTFPKRDFWRVFIATGTSAAAAAARPKICRMHDA